MMQTVIAITENLVTFSVLAGTMAQCAKQIRDNKEAREEEEYDTDGLDDEDWDELEDPR